MKSRLVTKNGSAVRNGSVGQEAPPETQKLARLLAAYAPYDGSFELRVPGVFASRMSQANSECFHTLRIPSLCLIAQGAKSIVVGQDVHEYDASGMLVFSVALPISSQVTQASQRMPYLGFRLELDPRKIAELSGFVSHRWGLPSRAYTASRRLFHGYAPTIPSRSRSTDSPGSYT